MSSIEFGMTTSVSAIHQLSMLVGASESDSVSFDLLPVLVFAIAFWVAVPIMVAIHEAGHALVGQLVGAEVILVKVGTGRGPKRFKAGNLNFEVAWRPVSGLTIAIPRNPTRPRQAAFALAGLVAELVALAFVWLLVSASWAAPIRWAILAIVVVHAFSNLWPRTAFQGGLVELSSDGQTLVDLLRGHIVAPTGLDRDIQVASIRAYLTLEAGDIDEGLEMAGRALALSPTKASLKGLYGTALACSERWEEAWRFLAEATVHADAEPLLCNNAAFAAIMTFDEKLLPDVDRLSAVALAAFPGQALIVVTRIAALVVLGEHEDAIALAARPAQGQLTRQNLAARSAFLALAHHNIGQSVAAESLLAEADELDGGCEAIGEVRRRIRGGESEPVDC